VNRAWLLGWQLRPTIFGTQNGGLRGGTENLPGIGAAYAATRLRMNDYLNMIDQMSEMRRLIMYKLSTMFPTADYPTYCNRNKNNLQTNPIEIVFLSQDNEHYVPNTLLLSVVKHVTPKMCNTALKNYMEKHNIIVSVGSACNTFSPKASHVLYAMNADDLIRAGAIRVSLHSNNTPQECDEFVRTFVEGIYDNKGKVKKIMS
jgi:cysteine sulfinate desulfinase/cysteine desulfurase-like protein